MQFDAAWKTAPKITDKWEISMNLLDALCKATEHKKQSIFLCFLGIIIESDGEVFQEVYHISWLINGKFWPEVCGHVHGQVRKLFS